jgi:hypothetical protein
MTTTALATTKAILDDPLVGLYDPDDEQERLAEILEQRYQSMLRAMHALLRAAFPELEDFRLGDDAVNRILIEAASRVVRIDEATRRAIAEQLRLGQALGLSPWEMANGRPDLEYRGIEGLFRETWRNRGLTVARTELQHAQVTAAVDRYQATGLVDEVKLVDGDQDNACSARNGKIVPIGQVPGLAHPNCTLALIPILREAV